MIELVVGDRLYAFGLPHDLKTIFNGWGQFNLTPLQVGNLNIPGQLNLFREEPNSSVSIPRGLTSQATALLQRRGLSFNLSMDPLTISSELKTRLNPSMNFSSGPFGYQERTVRELIKYHTCRLQACTAAGKTVLACLAMHLTGEGPVLFLANKDRLLKQFMLEVTKVLGVPESEIGIIKAAKFKVQPITCGSLQTLGKEDFDLQSLKNTFATVFYDECHLSTAVTYRRVLLGLAPKRLFGLSATPEHYASEDLNRLMEALLGPIEVKLDESEIPKRMVPETFTRETGLTMHYNASPDSPEFIKRKCLNRVYKDLSECTARNEIIVNDCIKLVNIGHKVMITVVRVAHAQTLYQALTEAGIKVSFPYKMQTDESSARVDHKKLNDDVLDVEYGSTKVIVGTYTLFDTGFNCRPLSALLMAAPFSGVNSTRAVQVVGRIQRYMPDKPQPVVLDYADDSTPFNLLRVWSDKRVAIYRNKFGPHRTIGAKLR